MIKNVVFDVGNIILEGTPETALKYTSISEKNKEILRNVMFNDINWKDLDFGIYEFDSYFELIKKDIPSNIHALAKEILFKSHEYRKFNNEIINLIKNLSNKYSIYILSNNNFNTYEYLKNTELNNYIDGWCMSCEYNL